MKMVLEIRERDGKGQGERLGSLLSWAELRWSRFTETFKLSGAIEAANVIPCPVV